MKLNINEKKVLYIFGCHNHRATVERMQLLAATRQHLCTNCKNL